MARKKTYGPKIPYTERLARRNYTLAADVEGFMTETQGRLKSLALTATEELINEVQTPVGRGGKMRVDTGFLRASGTVSFTGVPSGPQVGRARKEDEPPDKIIYDTKPAAIVGFKDFTLGTTIYFGWTAKYAEYREAYDGFLISGVQNWQAIVNRVAEKLSKRILARRKK